MSARLLRLADASGPAAAPTPLPRVLLDELHALLTLDPIAGASPARTLFLVSQHSKARLAALVCPSEREAAIAAPACAVVGYDFPFAVSLVQSTLGLDLGVTALAIRTAARSAALQGDGFARAASALGLAVTPIANFDAAALRAEFFAGAEATVVFVGRLDPAGFTQGPSRRPECPKPSN